MKRTQILGVDFTSTPTRRKPITAAWGYIADGVLTISSLELLDSFRSFEQLLARPDSWVGAFDFPFALPRAFVSEQGQATWLEYVEQLCDTTREAFVGSVRRFMADRPVGRKRPSRLVDRLAGSASSLNIDRPPVGKMFYEGIRRLFNSGVSIVPCHQTPDARVALEGYPRLVAQSLAAGKYKSEDRRADHRDARTQMVSGFRDGRIRARYGFDVCLQNEVRNRLLADESGDQLDAVLCAVQAGWASQQISFSVPYDCQADEGWIVDPATSTLLPNA